MQISYPMKQTRKCPGETYVTVIYSFGNTNPVLNLNPFACSLMNCLFSVFAGMYKDGRPVEHVQNAGQLYFDLLSHSIPQRHTALLSALLFLRFRPLWALNALCSGVCDRPAGPLPRCLNSPNSQLRNICL